MFSIFLFRGLFKRSFHSFETRILGSYGIYKMRYFPNTYESANCQVPANPAAIHDLIHQNLHNILEHVKPDARSVDGGLYVGSPGVAFMLYHLAKNFKSDASEEYFSKAAAYIEPAILHPDKDRTSFLLGDAGTQAIAAAIHDKLGHSDLVSKHLENYQSLHKLYLEPGFLKCGADELFVGRAGYLAGALWLSRELGKPAVPAAALHRVCDAVVASGRHFAHQHRSPCPLMYSYYRTQYLGAAHGLSFIMQMLLTVPGYIASDESVAADVKATVDFLVTLQSDDGNWPCAMDEVGNSEHKLVHWCHGAPGIVYLMARAYLVFGDEKYLTSCKRAAEVVWQRGLLRKGPGICHGIAGSGYVFLLLYRLTNDDKYLHRAYAFADFLQTPKFKEARVPDNPYSLYEGTAGTLCFLIDLLNPSTAEFPFQDVFTTFETAK